jgi:2-(1,2-epoxy-1,2-dihydrophenyl)acetyl-CoA isomerase
MSELEIIDDGAVRQVFINRPGNGNALSFGILEGLRETFDAAARDAAVRAVLVSGRGKLFCAGGDVKEWKASKERGTGSGHDWGSLSKALILAIVELKKPVVAAINGAAAGAGLDLACACDFRFATETARFICAYTRVGFAPDAGGTWFLPRLIGLSAAKRLVFTGDAWSAAEALACGLVDKVIAPDALMAEALAFAQKLASGPTVAIGEAKALLNSSSSYTLADQMEREHAAAAVCRETADHREGLNAANERRAPVFSGR